MLYNQQCDQSHNQIRTSQNVFEEVNKIELKYMSVIFTRGRYANIELIMHQLKISLIRPFFTILIKKLRPLTAIKL